MNWKSIVAVAAALIVGFGVLVRIATRPPEPPAQQLFINGNVMTMDANNRIVEALAVRADRIEAVGSTGEIMALAEEGAEVVDLAGRTLLPGFIDAHGHFPGSGQKVIAADLGSPPVGTVTTMAELLAALRQRAEQTPPGEWVSGFNYDDTLLAEQRHPTREELDAVSSDHPVVATHVSGHLLVAN
nr:amidohydrolase family protein [Halioglobus sp.]